MNKYNSFCHRLVLLNALLFSIACPVHIKADDQSSITSEISELIFKNCEQTLQIIQNKNSSAPLSSFQKMELAQMLSRVLKLGASDFSGSYTQNTTSASPHSISGTLQSTDLSRLFDPALEEDAKHCAVRVLKILGDEAVPSIPQLLALASDKRIAGYLRESAFTSAISLSRRIATTLSEDIRSLFIRELKNYDRHLSEPFVASALINMTKNFPRELLNILPELKYAVDPILISTEIVRADSTANPITKSLNSKPLENEKTSDDPSLILVEMLPDLNATLQRKILNSLLRFPQASRELFYVIPKILPFLSEDLRPLIYEIMDNLSTRPIDYLIDSNDNPDLLKLINSYMEALRSGSPEMQHHIIKLLAPVRISGGTQACEARAVQIDSPLLSIAPSADYLEELLRAHICVPTKDQAQNHLKNLSSSSFANKVISIVALGEHQLFTSSGLNNLHKILTSTSIKKESAENTRLKALSLLLLSKAEQSSSLKKFVPIALKSLYENAQLPPAINLLHSSITNENTNVDRHPGAAFLIEHGQHALPQITKLLSDDSSLVRKRALEIIISPMILRSSASLNATLKSIEDPELKIRSSAYSALKNEKSLPVSKLKTLYKSKSPITRTYASALLLGLNKNNQPSSPESSELLQNFIESSHELSCKERIHLIEDVQGYLTDDHEKKTLSANLISCLNQPQAIRNNAARILKHIPSPEDNEKLLKVLETNTSASFSTDGIVDILDILSSYPTNAPVSQFINSYEFKSEEPIGLLRWLSLHRNLRDSLKDIVIAKIESSSRNWPSVLASSARSLWTDSERYPASTLDLLEELGFRRQDTFRIGENIETIEIARSVLELLDRRENAVAFTFNLKVSICKKFNSLEKCDYFLPRGANNPLDVPTDTLLEAIFLLTSSTENPVKEHTELQDKTRRSDSFQRASMLIRKAILHGVLFLDYMNEIKISAQHPISKQSIGGLNQDIQGISNLINEQASETSDHSSDSKNKYEEIKEIILNNESLVKQAMLLEPLALTANDLTVSSKNVENSDNEKDATESRNDLYERESSIIDSSLLMYAKSKIAELNKNEKALFSPAKQFENKAEHRSN